jgi:hypothetical protein
MANPGSPEQMRQQQQQNMQPMPKGTMIGMLGVLVIMMVVMMFVIVIVLLSRVMPVFSQVFSQLGTSVGAVTQMLMNISAVLSRYYTVMIVLFVLFVLFYLFRQCLGLPRTGGVHAVKDSRKSYKERQNVKQRKNRYHPPERPVILPDFGKFLQENTNRNEIQICDENVAYHYQYR